MQKPSLKNAAVIEFKPSPWWETTLHRLMLFQENENFISSDVWSRGNICVWHLTFWNLKIKTKKVHLSSQPFDYHWRVLVGTTDPHLSIFLKCIFKRCIVSSVFLKSICLENVVLESIFGKWNSWKVTRIGGYWWEQTTHICPLPAFYSAQAKYCTESSQLVFHSNPHFAELQCNAKCTQFLYFVQIQPWFHRKLHDHWMCNKKYQYHICGDFAFRPFQKILWIFGCFVFATNFVPFVLEIWSEC